MTKAEPSDAELDETYDPFEPAQFDLKKQIKTDEEMQDDVEDETVDHFSDDQQLDGTDMRTVGEDDDEDDEEDDQHHQQQDQQMVTLQNVDQRQSTDQQQQAQQQQQQQHHLTQADERLIIPYHEIHHHHGSGGGGVVAGGSLTGTSVETVSAPSTSTADIIRLIHPSHAQAASVTTSDGQTVYMTAGPATTGQQQQQQQLIISHPVSLTRFSHTNAAAIEAHMAAATAAAATAVDGPSPHQHSSSSSGSSLTISSSSNHVAASTAQSVAAAAAAAAAAASAAAASNSAMQSVGQQHLVQQHHQHHQQQQHQASLMVSPVSNGKPPPLHALVGTSSPVKAGGGVIGSGLPSASPNGLNYFLMDIQMQMEKLSDIAQMEMKVEIQKLLLDKLRNADNYMNILGA